VLGTALLVSAALLAPQASAAASTKSYIVVFKDTVLDPATVATQQGRAHGFQASFVYRWALKGYAARMNEQLRSPCPETRSWPRSRRTA